MSKAEEQEEFYNKLKVQLQDTNTWPAEYLYKFIVTTSDSKIKQVQEIFDNMGAVIITKESKNAKYTSISINVRMKNPDAVIAKYKQVGREVEGIISL